MVRMPPRKTITLLLLIVLLMFTALVWSNDSSARPLFFQQTWPSRTPTSPPSPPTDSPPGGEQTSVPPGGDPGGSGTATAIAPGGDSTPIFLAPTPIGGYLPTAEPCGTPPTAQSLAAVNVREGPGLDYAVMNVLIYLEVRPLVGRAADATWWLIELVDGAQGWVFDQAVLISGYTGEVEIVDAPALGDETPTPGIPWQPTPNPICTPQPTRTALPEMTATPAPSPAITELTQATETATSESPVMTATPSPIETASPVPSVTPIPTEAAPTATPPLVEPITGDLSQQSEEQGDGGTSWFLIGGIGLILVGGVVYIIQRRSA